MKMAAKKYPTHTQSHDCHQEMPLTIIDEDIIHVFWPQSISVKIFSVPGRACMRMQLTILKLSLIQKATKLNVPHFLRSGSTV
jgi:hypothetical protein